MTPRWRGRSLDLYLHLTHGVIYDQPPRMQGNSRRKRQSPAVFAIAQNGKTRLRQLEANLMLAASQRVDFEKRNGTERTS